MIIKKYIGSNMKDALSKVEKDLGKDAVIISQRSIKQTGFKGFFLPKVIEITAAVESNPIGQDTMKMGTFNDRNTILKVRNEDDIKQEVEEMKNLLSAYIREKSDIIEEEKKTEDLKIKTVERTVLEDKDIYQEILEDLKDEDILSDVASSIIEKLKLQKNSFKNKEEALLVVKEILGDIIKVDKESDISGIVALVGPTGVGKTTTIAKLAGNLALVQKKKVGLITVDTYRIGAVEQLRTYADIMNIKFKVVFSISEMEGAIESMKDCDVVLVDTTGRSSKNAMQVLELKAFVEKANVDNAYLVVSATTKNRDMNIIAEGFSTIKYKGLIITKLDETSSYGSIVNICSKTKVPIKFVTFGQNVPEDIRVPSDTEIVKLVLGENEIC